VRIFDRNLNEKRESEQYASYAVSAVFADGAYAAVSFNNGITTDENEIFVFDKKGEMVYNSTVSSDVEQMSVCNGYIFIKNSEGVMRVRIKDSSSSRMSCQSGRMLIYNEKTALVCAQAKAVYLKFDD
jgi:hypothetical protein